MKFPRADHQDNVYGGWTIDPKYLERIEQKCDGVVKKTLIEFVLLAVEDEDAKDNSGSR